MLVLTRKPGEKVRIGPDVWLTVVRVNGGQVRIGIEAPREVAILRGEIAALGWRADETVAEGGTAPHQVEFAASPSAAAAG